MAIERCSECGGLLLIRHGFYDCIICGLSGQCENDHEDEWDDELDDMDLDDDGEW